MIYKKIGVIAILAGLFIPLILYPFTTLSDSAIANQAMANYSGASYNVRISELVIVLSESGSGYNNYRSTLPYSYFLAAGIVLLFSGASLLIFFKNSSKLINNKTSKEKNIENLETIDIRKIAKSDDNQEKSINIETTLLVVFAFLLIASFAYSFLNYNESGLVSNGNNSHLNNIFLIVRGGIVSLVAYIGIKKLKK